MSPRLHTPINAADSCTAHLWGLSPDGDIFAQTSTLSYTASYTTPWGELGQETVIGVMYDDFQGTLTFYKDGINLGAAWGLKDVQDDLYPFVSTHCKGVEVNYLSSLQQIPSQFISGRSSEPTNQFH